MALLSLYFFTTVSNHYSSLNLLLFKFRPFVFYLPNYCLHLIATITSRSAQSCNFTTRYNGVAGVARRNVLVLIVKVPRPENGERTFSVFESSCHLSLPV